MLSSVISCSFFLLNVLMTSANDIQTCCLKGIEEANSSSDCRFRQIHLPDVSLFFRDTCHSIVEVCCLNQRAIDACEFGQRTALQQRDALHQRTCSANNYGSMNERFTVCCQCCKLGLIAKNVSTSCQAPGLGEQCDVKFTECCNDTSSNKSSTLDDLDCTNNNKCDQFCVTNESQAHCDCHKGYKLAENGHSCVDVDECSEELHRCRLSEQCKNTVGGSTCVDLDCPAGNWRNPLTGHCEVIEGTCQTGFAYNRQSSQCEDINECGLAIDNCGFGERCENTYGGYECRRIRNCGTGYTMDLTLKTCVDNDECLLGTHNCVSGFACRNVQGSFRCIPKYCPFGFRFNSTSGECQYLSCPRGMRPLKDGICKDINECSEGSHQCQRQELCQNIRGSYRCRMRVECPGGFEPTENGGCQDINECLTNANRCGVGRQCVNRQGSYFCQCPRGLRHEYGGRCVDVDECSYGAIVCPMTSTCVNTIGSFRCLCRTGYVTNNNGSCVDVDECTTINLCQQACRNVQGSYFCTCHRGYQLRDDKRSCEDIDECRQFHNLRRRGGICGGQCINTPGSYRCDCPPGWIVKADGRSCQDIDECSDGTSPCSHADSICINTQGSRKCPVIHCPYGFTKTTVSGNQNSIRCKRESTDCPECKRGLLGRSYNFLTFPSNVLVPAQLFSMTGARDRSKSYHWYLTLISARPLQSGIKPADISHFWLEKSYDQAIVNLIRRVDGPQDVELRLNMNITGFYTGLEGTAESYIFLYITKEQLVY